MLSAIFCVGMCMCPWRLSLILGIMISTYSFAYALATIALLGWFFLIVRSIQHA